MSLQPQQPQQPLLTRQKKQTPETHKRWLINFLAEIPAKKLKFEKEMAGFLVDRTVQTGWITENEIHWLGILKNKYLEKTDDIKWMASKKALDDVAIFNKEMSYNNVFYGETKNPYGYRNTVKGALEMFLKSKLNAKTIPTILSMEDELLIRNYTYLINKNGFEVWMPNGWTV